MNTAKIERFLFYLCLTQLGFPEAVHGAGHLYKGAFTLLIAFDALNINTWLRKRFQK